MPDNTIRVLLKGDSQQLQDALKRAESSLNKLSPKLKDVGRKLTTFVSLPLAGAGAAAIKFASDMQESANKVDVAFGNSAKIVKDFAQESLESFGIAEGSALDMAAMFGDMSTSMGISQLQAANLSTQLVGLAGDLASFKNINIEEVTTALSGVFTGETESLKRLGVVMTEVNLEQFRMEQGIRKTYKEMSQAERVMLRYQYVMGVTSNAHGDFERTGGGAANQMRIFQESLKELASDFGEILLPQFTKLINKVNETLKEFKNLDIETKETIVQFGLFATAIPPVLWALGQLATAFRTIKSLVVFLNGTAGLSKLLTLLKGISGAGTALFAPLLLSGDERRQQEGDLDALIAYNKAVQRTGDVAANAGEILRSAFGDAGQIETPKVKLPFGRDDKIVVPTPIAGDPLSDLDENIRKAQEMSAAVDNIIETDSQLQYALASQAAGVASFGAMMSTVSGMFTEASEETTEATKQMTINFQSMAQSIGNALTSVIVNGGSAFQALGQLILGTLGDLLVQMGTAAIAAAELAKTFAIPIVGTAAGIAAIAIGTMLKGLSSRVQSGGFAAFANGGIVSTPTLGLVGEYAGARQNPEVIAPLDKLKSMIGDRGGNVNVSGEFRLSGQDLVVALERADNIRNRTT